MSTGAVAPRVTAAMKKCSKCGIDKAFAQFAKRAASRDGFRSQCRICHAPPAAEKKAYNAVYAARPENKAKAKLRANTPAARATQSLWAKKNKPRLTAKTVKYRRARYASDPEFRMTVLLRNRLNKVMKGKTRGKSAMELLGCPVTELWAHLATQFQDGMTRENHGQFGWHVDHIRPLVSFDLASPAQLAAAWHWSNLQPLWASDNLRKGGK